MEQVGSDSLTKCFGYISLCGAVAATDGRVNNCVQLLRTPTTWHCPHSSPHVAAAALSRAAIDRYLMLVVVVVVRFFNNNYDKRIVNKASTQCKQQCQRKI